MVIVVFIATFKLGYQIRIHDFVEIIIKTQYNILESMFKFQPILKFGLLIQIINN